MRPVSVEVFDYRLAEVDSIGVPQYFGYEDMHGNWYIAQNTAGAWRYAKGESDFFTNWTGRTGLSYNYPSTVW